MGRLRKFFWDFQTYRDFNGPVFWRAVRFALSNPQFPKWEDFKKENPPWA